MQMLARAPFPVTWIPTTVRALLPTLLGSVCCNYGVGSSVIAMWSRYVITAQAVYTQGADVGTIMLQGACVHGHGSKIFTGHYFTATVEPVRRWEQVGGRSDNRPSAPVMHVPTCTAWPRAHSNSTRTITRKIQPGVASFILTFRNLRQNLMERQQQVSRSQGRPWQECARDLKGRRHERTAEATARPQGRQASTRRPRLC